MFWGCEMGLTRPHGRVRAQERDAMSLGGEVASELYELRCADVHPLRCDERLRARTLAELIEIVVAHGARSHGFTPAWYSHERRRAIAGVAAGRARID